MTVPPEPGSDFGRELQSGAVDGYYDRDWLVTECMSWLGLSKPEAEHYVDSDVERAIEAVQSQVRR
jgi:hypothetical protein